jgi:protein gp37
VDCEVGNVSTKIEWCKNQDGSQGKTWNPVVGCTHAGSPGCDNCYAREMHNRRHKAYLASKKMPEQYAWSFDIIQLIDERMCLPLHWRKPKTVFVNSVSDLFHPEVPNDFIHCVYDVMEMAKQHTFIVCTKRPERIIPALYDSGYLGQGDYLPNVWHLCTVENQEMADKRIPELLRLRQHSPGWRVLGVSVEPMLGPINLRKWLFYQMRCTKCKDTGWVTGLERPCLWCNPGGEFRSSVSPAEKFKPKLDWVICGGETGPDARPVHPDWVRGLRDQCQSAGVPFFFKQWGEYCFPSQMPEETYQALQDRYNLDVEIPWKVGKKAAGRLLDGREWNELPGRPVSGCHGER